MEFIPSKCTVNTLQIHSPPSTPYMDMYLLLDSLSSSKYLGVTLNDHLTWNDYIQNMVTSANKTLGFLTQKTQVSGKLSL